MDDKLERELLISEIKALEKAAVDLGEENFPDLSSVSSAELNELRALKKRFTTLVRTLGASRGAS